MRIRVLSDLHLEFLDWNPPAVPADVVVLAGDIHVGADGIVWGRRQFAHCPIVYVPGNHEFFGSELAVQLRALRRAARAQDVHLLDGDAVLIDGVRFLGATLWTDFALYGDEPHTIEHAMAVAERGMVDYRVIRSRFATPLTPSDTRAIHLLQARWLARELSLPCEHATVVVTHHLPHPNSVHPRYAADPMNPAFASDLSALVRDPVRLWIHGHTHESMDYVTHGTRVVCNPRGYLPQEPNAAFDPGLVVELSS